MRKFPLVIFASALLALGLACGGGAGTSPTPATTTTGSGGGTPQQAKPLPEAHYVATAAVNAAGMTRQGLFYGAAGNLSPVFIVSPDGSFRGELDGFQHLRGALVQAPDGSVSLTGNCTWTHPDGTTQDLTLSGSVTADGHLTGTSNAGSFDLTLSSSLDTPLTIDQVAGVYVTQATSSGVWARITITAPAQSGNIAGFAYASQADALADTNRIGRIEGSLTYADADPQHLHNVWNIGFNTYLNSDPSTANTTYGLACFEGTTLVSLCANHLNPTAGQFSCTFAKQ